MVCSLAEGAVDASDRTKTKLNERTVMKNKALAGVIVTGLVMSGATFSLLAQNGPGQGRNGCGKGYGGPPQSQEERAARQAACHEKNGGICPNGGPKANYPGYGQGGQGQGKGARQGVRDGTGPRSANGTCPNTPAQTKK
jgi:hypothetical protein